MENIQEIFKRYLEGTCTAEELEFLLTHFREGKLDPGLAEQLEIEFQRDESGVNVPDELQRIVRRNRNQLAQQIKPSFRKSWFSIAAVLLVVSGVTFYFWDERSGEETNQPAPQVSRISPGGNKATIILADGKTIDLSNQQNGIVIGGDNSISYTDGTPIPGISADTADNDIPVFQLATPKGGTYQIMLSDGTRVWLNAASRLTYPQQFAGASREVILSGEAYFVVAESREHPFVVRSKDQEVTVLGTEFNITAYEDEESTRTTLINGAIKVAAEKHTSSAPYISGQDMRLYPGQQSILTRSGLIARQADPKAETAWRDGKFYFENQTITSVMRQLVRWYDIEVIYENGVEDRVFSGSMSRFSEIEEILHNLELTKAIRFQITGRRVTVMP